VNFKGIHRADVRLGKPDRANVVTLIGLNESGKTTLLEGIYSFSPDYESRTLFDNKLLTPDAISRIPKSELYSFNDRISVIATVSLEDGERELIKKDIEQATGLVFDDGGIRDAFQIEDYFDYKNSEKSNSGATWAISLRVKTKRAQKWRRPDKDENTKIFKVLQSRLPSIAYFPTFLSDVPAKIYLRGHTNDPKNAFYRRVFQDILDSLDSNITIEEQILERLKPPATFTGTISETIASFWGSGSRHMVQQVIDKASGQLSRIIVSRWNEMFENNKIGKEIVIDWGVDEDIEGQTADPYISFAIKDGANRFNIADRSLGFRWFFCFLLFTQFRAKRRGGVGTLFLFDEPASNLHAKAQEKLLDSFKDICMQPNALIYSTHSPYMINPYWLDNAYIVENTALGSDLDDIASMAIDDRTSIETSSYHAFVEAHPDRLSHFQPVLDRLEVKPSILDVVKRSVLVEGKSDYVILNELAKAANVKDLQLIPAHGASTMGALVALLKGWGWPFLVLVDGDKAGQEAKQIYASEYNIADRAFALSDVVAEWKAVESVLHADDLKLIASSGKPTKKQIYSFFVESAEIGSAKKKLKTPKSSEFKKLINFLQEKLS
jgi:ABC-type Mn2+/Zn2+ transport system ATPase subunit